MKNFCISLATSGVGMGGDNRRRDSTRHLHRQRRAGQTPPAAFGMVSRRMPRHGQPCFAFDPFGDADRDAVKIRQPTGDIAEKFRRQRDYNAIGSRPHGLARSG